MTRMYNGIDLDKVARPLICEVCLDSEGQPEGKCLKGHKPFVGRSWNNDGTFNPDPTNKHYICYFFRYGDWG